LWSTFGISRLWPFKDSYNKEMMRKWKSSEAVRKVHEELYNPSNPDDPSSDTYLSSIIQATFTPKERTKENAIWAQSVLEAIFDEDYLDSKIDAEVVEKWNKSLQVVSIRVYLVFFVFELLLTLMYIIFSLMTFQKVKNLLSLNPMNPVKQLRNKTTTMLMMLVMVMVMVLKPEAPTNTPNTSNLSIHF
jgi:hypothetical protein